MGLAVSVPIGKGVEVDVEIYGHSAVVNFTLCIHETAHWRCQELLQGVVGMEGLWPKKGIIKDIFIYYRVFYLTGPSL